MISSSGTIDGWTCTLRCRSYYSAEGCAGNVAQYDLVSERCSVYGYPIGATGTFTCDADGTFVYAACMSEVLGS